MVKFSPATVAAATTMPTSPPVTLGSSSSSPTISLPAFPALDADPLVKKVALRAAIASILPHVESVPSRAIFDVFSSHIPIAMHAIDAECAVLCNTVRDAFLRPGHPAISHAALDFLNCRGASVLATLDLPEREKHAKSQNKCLAFVLVSASATDLTTFHPSLTSLGPQSASFLLKLPTSLSNTSSATSDIPPLRLNSTTDSSSSNDSTGTPRQPTQQNVPPSMSSVVTTSSNSLFPQYYGDFTFLTDQASFTKEFGPAIPTTWSSSDTNQLHQLQPTPYSHTLPTLTRLCYFTCFCHLLEADYVGVDISNDSATQAVFHKLRQLTASRFDATSRKKTYHSPTQLFQDFSSFIPSLDSSSPAAIAAWPSSLAQQFFSNLNPDIQNALYKGKHAFTIKDHASLPSLSAQLAELRSLANAAQLIYDEHNLLRSLCSKQVSTMFASLQPPQNPAPTTTPNPPLPPDTTTTLLSPAESVLQKYQQSASNSTTTQPPDTDYPIDPYSDTQYQSRFPRSFRGCYRCGHSHPRSADGTREECPLRKDPSTKTQFFKDYLAHHPDKRRFYDNGNPVARDAHDRIIYPPPIRPNPRRRSTEVNITQPSSTHRNDPSQEPPLKKQTTASSPPNPTARTLIVSTISLNLATQPALRPIPVAITPTLPTIDICLGEPDNQTTLPLPALLDTCASLNSGLYSFHRHIATTHPACVHSFIDFNDSSQPFEPVRLTGAVTDTTSFDPNDFRGLLRAVVTYILPYTFSDGSPVHLSIALGDDIAVNTILGWPFCHAVHGLLDCRSSTFLARQLNATFPVHLRPPSNPQPPPSAAVDPQHSLLTEPKPTPRPTIDNRPAWLSRKKVHFPDSDLHTLAQTADPSLPALTSTFHHLNSLTQDFQSAPRDTQRG